MVFQISDQLRSFGLAILLGLAAGVVYDLLRTVRLRFPSFTGVLDLLYCLTAGGALSLFVLRQGRRTVPGVHPAGGRRGQRGVFHAVFRFSASRLGFLAGSERGIFTPAGLACAERLVNLQKNRQADEKPLLFL